MVESEPGHEATALTDTEKSKLVLEVNSPSTAEVKTGDG